jgi:hypothetical protein
MMTATRRKPSDLIRSLNHRRIPVDRMFHDSYVRCVCHDYVWHDSDLAWNERGTAGTCAIFAVGL